MSSRAGIASTCVLLLLAACTPPAAGPKPTPRPSEPAAAGTNAPVTPLASAASTPGPVASASAGPAASPTAALPSPAPAGGQLLKPESPVTTLSGTVRLDAAYLVASGAGNIVATGGGNVLAAGAGVISHNGSALTVGGNIVASGAGNIVASGAGNFLSHNGSAIISHNGSSIIGHNGSAVVSHNGSAFRLAAATDLPVGTLLPAAGMQLRVVTLTPPQRELPLGVDEQGRPVYSIYSNDKGGYTVYIPAEEQGNVMVQVVSPASTDRKTQYDLLVDTDHPEAAEIDEDSALTTEYLVTAFTSRFEQAMEQDLDAGSAIFSPELWGDDVASPALKQAVGDVVGKLNALARPKGLTGPKAERVRRYFVARQTALALLGDMDLATIPTHLPGEPIANSSLAADLRPPKVEFALDVLEWYVAHYRQVVQKRLGENPAYFDQQPYLLAANACKVPAQHYRIQKPSDFCDLWVREYWGATTNGVFGRMADTMVGLTPDEAIDGQIDLLRSASTSLLANVILELKRQLDAEQGPAIDTLRNYDPAAPLPAGLEPPALPCLDPVGSGAASPSASPAGGS